MAPLKRLKEQISALYGNGLPADKIEKLTKVLLTIREQRGITIDELAAVLGADYGTVARLTGILQADGLISIDLLQRCCINICK